MPSSRQRFTAREMIIATAVAGAAAAAAARGASAEDQVVALDLRGLTTQSARVEPIAGTGAEGGYRVTFQPAEWPTVKLTAPAGKPWDWRPHGCLLVDLKNLDQREVEVGIRVDDDPAADGRVHSRTAQVKLGPGEAVVVAAAPGRPDPMSHGMRGLPARQAVRSRDMWGEGAFDPGHVTALHIFLHRPAAPRTIEIRSVKLAQPPTLRAIVDPLGQYARADWPGKVRSEADMKERHRREAEELREHSAPPGRNRFGGWSGGPAQHATGFFRTARIGEKWWFVDPDGAPFISLGVDVVSPGEATIITGRESMFASLPARDGPLARFYGTAAGIHSGPVKQGETFNFYAANLQRVHGRDFFPAWKRTTLDRLRSWGFNTIGNWSDHRLYRNGQVPYVATVTIGGKHARVGSGSDYWGKMHDPFDPQFVESVRGSLRGTAKQVQGDAWCLGYFVDNELSWGGFGDEGGRYGLALGALDLAAEASPAKRAMIAMLRKTHGDINRLNESWKTRLASWRELESPWKPASDRAAWTGAFRSDLGAFVRALADAYFQTVRRELKAADPDHLYLGCRFAWRTEEAVAAAAEACDVVSFNIYDRRVDPKKWAFLQDLGRPAIIGEFHAGALDRGMFHTGLVAAADQKERAAIYADYVGSVLDNPALVGCHWFQFVDEPLTGRFFDGENYNIGFVTVTDTPYPELVSAARAIHREAYARRAGAKQP